MRAMTPPLVSLLQTPDPAALNALLAETVRFRSPVADYEGRADVAHLLTLIATVVDEIQPTRELEDATGKTTFIDAVVGDKPVQGVLDEHYDESGLLIEATLMLRPLSTLRIAVAAMAAALDAEPLPSAR
ncbi:MAG: hypothetical protein ACRDOJ_08735 [Nocardioidaceae bacterium]